MGGHLYFSIGQPLKPDGPVYDPTGSTVIGSYTFTTYTQVLNTQYETVYSTLNVSFSPITTSIEGSIYLGFEKTGELNSNKSHIAGLGKVCGALSTGDFKDSQGTVIATNTNEFVQFVVTFVQ